MAIKSITLNNFRGQTRQLNFDLVFNTISGPNGIGKSTVKEAICFAYAGTDSIGTRSPRHLISNGQNDCSVIIETERSTLSRTLTAKGNGTIKLTKNEISTALTQTQLEQMVGSTDMFLSCFIPGYFFGLPAENKQKVLAEVLPKIDRHEILSRLCGFPMQPEEKIRYDLTKRLDLVASTVSADRRNTEREIDQMAGETNLLMAVKAPGDEPSDNGAVHKLQVLMEIQRAWEGYDKAMVQYNHAISALKNKEQEEVLLNERKAKLQQELAGLIRVNVPTYEAAPTAELLAVPQKPHTANELNFDQCPTCGSKVGSKQKQDVIDRNKKCLDDYAASVAEIEKKNSEIRDNNHRIQQENAKLYNAHQEAVMYNRNIDAKRTALEKEIAGITPSKTVGVPETPVAPSGVYDQGEEKKLQSEVQAYNQALGSYHYALKNYDSAQARLGVIGTKLEPLRNHVARLGSMEQNIKRVVNEELRMMSEAMAVDDVTMIVGDVIKFFRGEAPYELLSTGQKMDVDIKISKKLNQHSRKINMIFIDDANLINSVGSVEGVQVFVANVDPSLQEILVH